MVAALRRFNPATALRSAPLRAYRRREEKAFRAGMWRLAMAGREAAQQWCEENGLALVRAQSEGVNSAGGFLAPAEIEATLITLRELRGAFRAAAQVTPMGSDAGTIPRRTGGLTAYFSAEAAALTESSMTFDGVGLVAKKLATFTRTSSELTEDSAIDLGDLFVTEMAYAFASKEDDCGFNGDGTSTYGGINGLANKLPAGGIYTATGHATFDVLTATDITQMMALLPSYAWAGARFFCSPYAFSLGFCRLAAAVGGMMVLPDANGVLRPTFMGIPVTISTVLPSTTPTGKLGIYFGDLSLAATLGERRGVTVAQSTHRYIDQDQVAWRATERVDIVVHDVGDATTAGPIVALKMG